MTSVHLNTVRFRFFVHIHILYHHHHHLYSDASHWRCLYVCIIRTGLQEKQVSLISMRMQMWHVRMFVGNIFLSY